MGHNTCMNSEMTMTERKDDLGATYWDFYKEVHGVRPRWVNHDEATIEWYEEALEQLRGEAEEVFAAEKEREDRAVAELEASIGVLIASGAGDRATAIRWLHEANDTNGDTEYLEFRLGIPYGYFRKEEVK